VRALVCPRRPRGQKFRHVFSRLPSRSPSIPVNKSDAADFSASGGIGGVTLLRCADFPEVSGRIGCGAACQEECEEARQGGDDAFHGHDLKPPLHLMGHPNRAVHAERLPGNAPFPCWPGLNPLHRAYGYKKVRLFKFLDQFALECAKPILSLVILPGQHPQDDDSVPKHLPSRFPLAFTFLGKVSKPAKALAQACFYGVDFPGRDLPSAVVAQGNV